MEEHLVAVGCKVQRGEDGKWKKRQQVRKGVGRDTRSFLPLLCGEGERPTATAPPPSRRWLAAVANPISQPYPNSRPPLK